MSQTFHQARWQLSNVTSAGRPGIGREIALKALHFVFDKTGQVVRLRFHGLCSQALLRRVSRLLLASLLALLLAPAAVEPVLVLVRVSGAGRVGIFPALVLLEVVRASRVERLGIGPVIVLVVR